MDFSFKAAARDREIHLGDGVDIVLLRVGLVYGVRAGNRAAFDGYLDGKLGGVPRDGNACAIGRGAVSVGIASKTLAARDAAIAHRQLACTHFDTCAAGGNRGSLAGKARGCIACLVDAVAGNVNRGAVKQQGVGGLPGDQAVDSDAVAAVDGASKIQACRSAVCPVADGKTLRGSLDSDIACDLDLRFLVEPDGAGVVVNCGLDVPVGKLEAGIDIKGVIRGGDGVPAQVDHTVFGDGQLGFYVCGQANIAARFNCLGKLLGCGNLGKALLSLLAFLAWVVLVFWPLDAAAFVFSSLACDGCCRHHSCGKRGRGYASQCLCSDGLLGAVLHASIPFSCMVA